MENSQEFEQNTLGPLDRQLLSSTPGPSHLEEGKLLFYSKIP